MKKQFLLILSLLTFGAIDMVADSSCCPTKKTDCCDTKVKNNCDDFCPLESGKTYLRHENPFQNATPLYASMFNTNAVRELGNDHQGAFQLAVYGGKNTQERRAASVYLPCGHQSLKFDGEVSPQTFLAHPSDDNNVGAGTFQYDPNKDTQIIRPWNFGITHAALFEPDGASAKGTYTGTGLLTNPTFKSEINPCLSYARVGAGMALRYHFSEDKRGWFGSISTAVEHVRVRWNLNETVSAEKTELTEANFAASNPLGQAVIGTPDAKNTSAANPVSSIRGAYINSPEGTGFPVEQDGLTNNPGNVPANVEEAFNQSAWNYGKIASGCTRTRTRLADIELLVGYGVDCSDCAYATGYVGVVIPTGNRVCPTYVADAVVGNGFHAGIMSGGSYEILLSEDGGDCGSWRYRLDTNGRYLFRNTQKRSFDLCDKQWSRYMMVWDSKDTYDAARTELGTNANPQRGYTPGINVFTADVKVKPRYQGRINQAFYYEGECLKAELGWNTFARQAECVEWACDWDKAPAFADSSFYGGTGLNNARTIHNDAQLQSTNQVTNSLAASGVLQAQSTEEGEDLYDYHAIKQADVNLNSAASSCVLTHTPYLTFGWSWETCDYPSQFSLGGSYTFGGGNRALNEWLVWGKFEFSF